MLRSECAFCWRGVNPTWQRASIYEDNFAKKCLNCLLFLSRTQTHTNPGVNSIPFLSLSAQHQVSKYVSPDMTVIDQ